MPPTISDPFPLFYSARLRLADAMACLQRAQRILERMQRREG